MNRRKFIQNTAITTALVSPSFAATNTRKPNILILFAADPGFGDIDFNGCTDIPTPNKDW